jgi:hypothetical protein
MLWRETRERLRDRGVVDPEPPSLKYAIPILEAAADEENEELEDLWSCLLAAAMDASRPDGMRQLFIQVVKQLDPMDAILADRLAAAKSLNFRGCLEKEPALGRADFLAERRGFELMANARCRSPDPNRWRNTAHSRQTLRCS